METNYNWNWLNNAIEVIKKDDSGLNQFWSDEVLRLSNRLENIFYCKIKF